MATSIKQKQRDVNLVPVEGSNKAGSVHLEPEKDRLETGSKSRTSESASPCPSEHTLVVVSFQKYDRDNPYDWKQTKKTCECASQYTTISLVYSLIVRL